MALSLNFKHYGLIRIFDILVMIKPVLDKVKMNVVRTASNGIVNEETIFVFSQNDNFVSASYSGGKIKQGYLVGYLDNDKLIFSFCQLQIDGKIDNGQSVCELLINENGKIKLIENFKWATNNCETGINIFQEI